ncbi:MAG: bacteriohemerythrin [Leptospiraceae bacterium]|nr:bacteriohemerythrin [Leptospiraceae bacterium]
MYPEKAGETLSTDLSIYSVFFWIFLSLILFLIFYVYKFRKSYLQTISSLEKSNKKLTKINQFYESFVPSEMLYFLGSSQIVDISLGNQIKKEMTVFFSDIRSFTSLSERNPPEEVLKFLNAYFERMNAILYKYHGIIDKYIGDAILAVFPGTVDDAISCAIEMQKDIQNQPFVINGKEFKISIGIGIHFGDVLLGVVGGGKLLQTTVISDVVNTASRLESLTKEYGASIIISEDILHNIEEPQNFNIRFLDYANIRGKEDTTFICEVYSADYEEQIRLKNETKELFDNGVMIFQSGEYEKSWEKFLEVLKENPSDKAAVYYLNKTANLLVDGMVLKQFHENDLVKWDQDWSTGIDVIDSQHKSLFEILNNLARAQKYGREMEVLSRIFNNLKIYVYTHFTLEEELMLKVNYPDFDNHKLSHLIFIGKVLDAEKDLKTGDKEAPKRVISFLSDWLISHIKHSDKEGYVPYVLEEYEKSRLEV